MLSSGYATYDPWLGDEDANKLLQVKNREEPMKLLISRETYAGIEEPANILFRHDCKVTEYFFDYQKQGAQQNVPKVQKDKNGLKVQEGAPLEILNGLEGTQQTSVKVPNDRFLQGPPLSRCKIIKVNGLRDLKLEDESTLLTAVLPKMKTDGGKNPPKFVELKAHRNFGPKTIAMMGNLSQLIKELKDTDFKGYKLHAVNGDFFCQFWTSAYTFKEKSFLQGAVFMAPT